MILFIDDDVDDRLLPFVAELRARFEVKTARNPDDALRIVRAAAHEIELIIWDMMMAPGYTYSARDHDSGMWTGALLRADLRRAVGPDVPMILFTNLRDPKLISQFDHPENASFVQQKGDWLPVPFVEEIERILSNRDPQATKGADANRSRPEPFVLTDDSERPKSSRQRPLPTTADVLIITALKEEYDEARRVETGAIDDWTVDRSLTGFEVAFRTYRIADGSPCRFALTWATRMRTTATADAAGRLLDKLGAGCLAMSGVCAGRRGKVNAGDVIIGSVLYTYDTGAVRIEIDETGQPHAKFQAEPNPLPFDEQWLHHAQAFKARATALFGTSQWLAERPPTLEAQGHWILVELRSGANPTKLPESPESVRRCPAWKPAVERLRKLEYVSAQPPLEITDSGAAVIDDVLLLHRNQLPGAPPWQVHVAPIATGHNVMRDPSLFDRLSDSMRDVLGVEMEAAAIAGIAHSRRLRWVVMKGVMDHADHDKDDGLKAFAARASAECLFAFLLAHWKTT